MERRHKNAGFGSISVTQRGCAGPISTVESHILERVHTIVDIALIYAGTKTITDRASVFTHKNDDFVAISLTSEAAPRRSPKWRVTYSIVVPAYYIPDIIVMFRNENEDLLPIFSFHNSKK